MGEQLTAYGSLPAGAKEAIKREYEAKGGSCFIGDKLIVCTSPEEPAAPDLAASWAQPLQPLPLPHAPKPPLEEVPHA